MAHPEHDEKLLIQFNYMRTFIMSNVIDMQIVKLRSKLELLLEDREKRIEAINSLKRIISDY